jgi:hypothetical protein
MLAVEVNWQALTKMGQSLAPWQWGLVVLVGSIGVWSLFKLKALFREDDGRTDGHLEMLTQFRELHRQGGISEDEYRLIKGQLVAGHVAQMPSAKRPSQSAKVAETKPETNPKVGPDDPTTDESRLDENPPTMKPGFIERTDREETDQTE